MRMLLPSVSVDVCVYGMYVVVGSVCGKRIKGPPVLSI